MVGKYRLMKSTLGIVASSHLARSVPEGSIVEIPTTPRPGDRTVEVVCDGETMVMFVLDLVERAERVAPQRRTPVTSVAASTKDGDDASHDHSTRT